MNYLLAVIFLLLDAVHLLHQYLHLLHVNTQLVRVFIIVESDLRLIVFLQVLQLGFVGCLSQLELFLYHFVLVPKGLRLLSFLRLVLAFDERKVLEEFLGGEGLCGNLGAVVFFELLLVFLLADLFCGLQLHLVNGLNSFEILLIIDSHFLLIHLILFELFLEFCSVLLALRQGKFLALLHFFKLFVVLVL